MAKKLAGKAKTIGYDKKNGLKTKTIDNKKIWLRKPK